MPVPRNCQAGESPALLKRICGGHWHRKSDAARQETKRTGTNACPTELPKPASRRRYKSPTPASLYKFGYPSLGRFKQINDLRRRSPDLLQTNALTHKYARINSLQPPAIGSQLLAIGSHLQPAMNRRAKDVSAEDWLKNLLTSIMTKKGEFSAKSRATLFPL